MAARGTVKVLPVRVKRKAQWLTASLLGSARRNVTGLLIGRSRYQPCESYTQFVVKCLLLVAADDYYVIQRTVETVGRQSKLKRLTEAEFAFVALPLCRH